MINYEKYVHEVKVNGETGYVVDEKDAQLNCERLRMSDIPRSGAYKTKEQAIRRARSLYTPHNMD